MTKNVRVLIAEDNTILREGLRAILLAHPGFDVCGEVCDGRDAEQLASSLQPDLVLMDVSMPGITGIDSASSIRKRFPNMKIIMLTIHKDQEYVLAALEAGANGYVLKDSTAPELISAIEYVLRGKTHISPELQEQLISGYVRGVRSPEPASLWTTLTQRERQVLKMVAEGRTNKEIASYLCISAKTVEKHRANLMSKLGVHNAAALTAYALSKGVISS